MQIYFSKNKGILIMVYLKTKLNKILYYMPLLINFFCSDLLGAIIYEKNEIIITQFDIEYYRDYYENLYSNSISQSKAIKDLILIKNLIRKLEKNKPDAIEAIDQDIKKQLGSNLFSNKDLLDFNRYVIIKNQFINEYFQNSLDLYDLEILKDNIKTLKVSLSNDKCITVQKNIAISEILNFEEILFEKIKFNNNKISTLFDNKNYEICFSKNLELYIEKELIKYIEKKIQIDLEKLIYEK